jgi:hypothetical protein
MTSREHARRLMLILLSSPGGADAEDEHAGAKTDDRQATEGRDDSTEGDEQRTRRLVDSLILT